MKRLLGTIAVAFAGGMLALGAHSLLTRANQSNDNSGYQLPVRMASYGEGQAPINGPDLTVAAEMTIHAVVHIKTEYERKPNYYDYFFDLRDFFNGRSQQEDQPIQGAGSGVIVSEDGYIITNNHVVENASSINVTLNNKRTYTAKVIGTDPGTDLALIKIDETRLPFIPFGNSDKVRIGEWVLAVGNPFNLTSTVTAGIVSAKARNINILSGADGSGIESFIQTDAAVNRGNSGGALVNPNGELIGINAAIASANGYYTGYSFAIPVNLVKKVYHDLKEHGEVHRAFLGIMFNDIDGAFADKKGLKDTRGVYVAEVVENRPAQKAGIKPGDIVLAIDDLPINSASELQEVIATKDSGEKVKISLIRDNKALELNVVLKEKNGRSEIAHKSNAEIFNQLGATLGQVPSDLRNKLGLKYGIQVVTLKDGILSTAGIKKGFIILKVDNKPVRSIDELQNILQAKEGGILIEGIYPSGMRAYYGFGL
jgi:Do/DeqQ family serine protease